MIAIPQGSTAMDAALDHATVTPRATDAVGYHDSIAARWSAGYGRRNFRNRLELFRGILDREVMPGHRWLDLGCGSGVLTAELLRRRATAVGVDASEPMLRLAGRHLAGEPEAWALRQGDVQCLAWSRNGAFDGILCSSTIEYIDDPHRMLAESSRVLRKDGTLVISLPPRGSVVRCSQRAARRAAMHLRLAPFKYLEFSRFEIQRVKLEEWLATAGFRLRTLDTFDPVIPRALHRAATPALLVCTAVKVA
jgi:ubiquinone/menaquinone biosynthesis C-methylase UbiE